MRWNRVSRSARLPSTVPYPRVSLYEGAVAGVRSLEAAARLASTEPYPLVSSHMVAATAAKVRACSWPLITSPDNNALTLARLASTEPYPLVSSHPGPATGAQSTEAVARLASTAP